MYSARSTPCSANPAPEFELSDFQGTHWSLRQEVRNGPVVIVFYLGSTCMACMTHLTELDIALSKFEKRGARVLAVSDDAPEFSLERTCRFGGFHFPLLSDRDHTAALAYGAWKRGPQGDAGTRAPLHGTFIVDRNGLVRWAYVGDRPFTDVDALLVEVDNVN